MYSLLGWPQKLRRKGEEAAKRIGGIDLENSTSIEFNLEKGTIVIGRVCICNFIWNEARHSLSYYLGRLINPSSLTTICTGSPGIANSIWLKSSSLEAFFCIVSGSVCQYVISRNSLTVTPLYMKVCF